MGSFSKIMMMILFNFVVVVLEGLFFGSMVRVLLAFELIFLSEQRVFFLELF